MKKYDKLVRDRIPEIINADGKECIVEVVDNKKKYELLERKLEEEVNEFLEDMKEYESKCLYNPSYKKFSNIEGGLIENPIYDYTGPVKALVIGETVPQAIYFFSDLESNGLSNQFDQYSNGSKGRLLKESLS